MRIQGSRWLVLAGLLAMQPLWSHDDLLGTRHVAMTGRDEGNCEHALAPCRSIAYALARTPPGGTVKVAEGLFSLQGLDIEAILHGKSGVLGGYRSADEFRQQILDASLTQVHGAPLRYRERLASRGMHLLVDHIAARQLTALAVERAEMQEIGTALQAAADCVQGFAGQFPCRNVDFLGRLSLAQLSSRPGSMSNLWGFVDRNTNREYAVVGVSNGTAVIDVTDPVMPREVGTVAGNASLWREVKVLQFFDAAANRHRAYAYISTEAVQGMQIIDLSDVPNSVRLLGTINEFARSHTLHLANVDFASNAALTGRQPFLYIAGANRNGGSFLIFDLLDPAAPRLVTQAPPGTGYMHDATTLYLMDQRTTQCDQGHNPCEVLVDFNESSIDLWDVTDKAQPVRLSTTTYPTARYTHSGWFSADQRAIFVHDELDELRIAGLNTQIYTLEIDDLRTPSVLTSYIGPDTTTDHNGYTVGDRYYVAHYRRGLVIYDVTNPRSLRELGSLDTFLSPSANVAGTDGAWGVYPFLPSGNVLVSDIDNGLFVLRDNTRNLGAAGGRIGFAAPGFSAAEASSVLRIRVRRSGGTLGMVSVQYATRDGTARAASDYTATSGTLTWNDGDDIDREIAIPLTNDSLVEENETFAVVLSGLSGAALDGNAELLVTIASDDGNAGSGGSGGGGGGTIDRELLLLIALLALVRGMHRRYRAAAARAVR